MRVIDISQPVFSCEVYPGDPAPAAQPLLRMEQGAVYNLSAFSMCAHNGTHIDAPFHFLKEGKTVEQLPPESFAGPCFVADCEGDLDAASARSVLQKAAAQNACRRILLRGECTVTNAAAEVFAAAGILLLGVESQSVGPVSAPMQVHLTLLEKEVVLLEGLRLQQAAEGRYLLCAAPLCLAGFDGAPCRAVLMQEQL